MQQDLTLKNATGIDTSIFARKVDLASLKLDVDKLDINELEKAPYGVNSLKSNVDKMMCISWSLFLLI